VTGGPLQPAPWAELELPGRRLSLCRLEGEEALSHPFRFRVTGAPGDAVAGDGEFSSGQRVRLRWGDGLGGRRSLAGQVTAWQVDEDRRLHAVIEPRLAQLARRAGYRYFPQAELEALTRRWLVAVGYDRGDPLWYVEEAPTERRPLLQAGESDLALLQRLWAQAGVTLSWRDGADERPRFTDGAVGLPRLETEVRLPGTDAPVAVEADWCVRVRAMRTPRPVPPGLEEATAAHLRRVRREGQAAGSQWLELVTRRVGMGAGVRVPVVVTGAAGEADIAGWGRWFLVTRVRHNLVSADQATSTGGAACRAEVEAVPEIVGATPRPYRPPEPVPPVRRLPVPARICKDGQPGATGAGEHPRWCLKDVAVRLLPFPPGGAGGCWQAPLVDGERVLVGCREGDADAPVLLGSLPVSGQRHPAASSRGRVGAYTTPEGRGVYLPGGGRRGERHAAGVRLDAAADGVHAVAARGGEEEEDRVGLEAGAGPLKLRAGAPGIGERAGAQRRERIEGERRVQADGGIVARCERTAALRAAGSVRLGGQGGLTADAGSDLRLHAGESLRVLAAEGTRLRVRRGEGSWQVQRGQLHLSAGAEISLRSRDGTVNLHNATGSAGIAVDAQGEVRIWGRRVVLDAEGVLSLGAEVHHRGGSG